MPRDWWPLLERLISECRRLSRSVRSPTGLLSGLSLDSRTIRGRLLSRCRGWTNDDGGGGGEFRDLTELASSYAVAWATISSRVSKVAVVTAGRARVSCPRLLRNFDGGKAPSRAWKERTVPETSPLPSCDELGCRCQRNDTTSRVSGAEENSHRQHVRRARHNHEVRVLCEGGGGSVRRVVQV